MNKKGFTLAEMLGVIVILAVITILALPPLLQSIRDNKSKLSSATEKLIFSATDLYLSNRANEYPRYNGSIYCVVINDLVESGDLLDDLKDVNTNANVDMTKMIKIEVNNGKYVKRIVESNECDRYMNFDYNSNISAVQGSTIPQCITDNFTCSLEDMKAGLPVMINVDGTNKYKFYIINDNDGLLTLISSSNYGNNINYSDSASNINGPDKALTNLPTNWINVVNQGSIIDNDVIIDYSGYSARLPKASEIASLADTNNWNQTVVSTIPAFLKENVGGGYWMSTGNSTNKAWFVLNSLNNSVITNSYKVRPVINIYKSSIGVGPLVSVKNEEEIEIISGSDNELIDYFNISSNGAMDIGNTSCVSSIDGNVTNTDDLSVGLHNITCTATSLSGLTSSDVKRINVIYKEAILNGADPVLSGNLIPVMISPTGVVTKVASNMQWYNYGNKQWANAVILKDESIIYTNGQTIPESNIESYFVWIPRYKYKLWYTETDNTIMTAGVDNTKPHAIDIVFENKNTTTSNGSIDGAYLTHPAFTSFDVNGIWVGKFETGYDGATSAVTAEVSSNDSSKIIIKPNTYSWRNNNVYNFFTSAYNYDRDLDSHMMKNTEWGAVAYLSHSVYGKNEEVYINNNSAYLTGCGGDTSSASGNPTCQNTYASKSNNLYNQSTTGNISGIFDMSGGAHERVSGYIGENYGSSGFDATNIGLYDTKYFDIYNLLSAQATYQYRILGDATGEMGPFDNYRESWYGDYGIFVNSSFSWFHRSGNYDKLTDAGVFYFSRTAGGTSSNVSSRLVLAF